MQLPPKDRIIRYFVASMCGVVIGSSCFLFFLKVLQWAPVPSNVAAVATSSVPAYIINRYWVWAKKDANSLKREVVPFWTMSFLGLLLSTILVGWAKQRTEDSLLLLASNLAGFGILWVAKFFVLDKVLFAATPEEHMEPPPLL